MKILARRIVRFIFRKLPASWRYQMHRDRYSIFEKQPSFRKVRQALYRIPLTENAFIDIFWKRLPIGIGPAASVVIYDHEILRFDCFGAGEGHLHASFFLPAAVQETRLFFSESSIDQQIERAVFDLTHNLYYYTQRSPYNDVRTFWMDKAHLQVAGEQMQTKMQAYIPMSV